MEPQPTLSDGHPEAPSPPPPMAPSDNLPETPSPPPMAPSDGLPEMPLPVRDSSPPCDPLPTPSHPCDHATVTASLLAISPQDEADADLAPERLSGELSSLPHEGHGDAPPAGEEAGLCVTGASGTDAPVAAAVSPLQVKAKQEVSSFPSEQGNCEVAEQLKAKPEVSSFPSEQGNREVAVQLKANSEVSSFPSEQGNHEVAVQLEAKPEVSSFPSEQGNCEVAVQLKAMSEVSSFPSEQGNREVAVQLKAKSEVSSFSSEQGNREVAVQLKANPEVSSFPSDQGNREVAGQLKANLEVSSFPSEQGNCEVAVQLKANPEVSTFPSDQGNREVAGQHHEANPEVSSFPSEQGNPEVAVQHHEANPEVSSFPSEHGNPEVAVQLKAKPEPQVSSCPSEQGNHEVAVQLKANPKVSSFPSKQGNHEVAQILELNRVGLPIRENARNCMYYMRNGNCRYGKRCCFNHPEHVLDVQLYKPTGWDDTNLPSSPHLKKSSSPHSKKSSEHATLDDISSSSEILPPNILRMLLPPQTLPPGSEAKEMKVKKDPDWSSASDDSDSCCSADSSDGPLCKQEHHVDYPGRPGRQECPFLLKYGNCKFASSCQYYHANDKLVRQYHQKDPSLSEELMVYPDKPGAPECPFYMKTGACKFGTECKFHHPKDLPPSMQGSTIPKRPLDPKEIHPETTLQYHMDQQQNYPERPGQPECRYYMQFGKCKFLSACIFHHPRDRVRSILECPFYMKTGTCQFGSACEFNHSGKGGEIDDRTEYGHNYPKRPGGNECFHYMEHGYCRFQMKCKYHHPTDRLSWK